MPSYAMENQYEFNLNISTYKKSITFSQILTLCIILPICLYNISNDNEAG